MSAEDEVLVAARALVEAFGQHATSVYFDCFAPDATFLFHSHDVPLRSRAEYRDVWVGWEADGFHVVSCRSSDQHVQPIGDDAAVFTHRVQTVVRPGTGSDESLDERETIVFRREPGGRWLAVHEHLSPS